MFYYYTCTVFEKAWKRKRMRLRIEDAHEWTKIILINLANSNGDCEEGEEKKIWNKLEIVFNSNTHTIIHRLLST